jgi:membrane-associated phospholipid phosphatase
MGRQHTSFGLELQMAKWLSPALLLCAALTIAPFCAGQDAPSENLLPTMAPESPTQPTAVDSIPILVPETPSESTPADPPDPVAVASVRPSSGRLEWNILKNQWEPLFPNLLRDQKTIYLFPLSAVRGHHWKPTLALIGATGLLMTVDAHNSRWVRNNLQPLSGFNNVFSGYNTATATEAFASAFYVAAILRKNVYDQKTFILAGEAVIDAEILTTVMKDLDGRMAPISYPAGGSFTDSWFKVTHGNRSSWMGGLGSMPSGHEIAIMAVATVFAERYPHPAWHKWVAYGLAAVAGFSRVSLQSHFTSDTFAGGALGYLIAHYVVLGRQHSN